MLTADALFHLIEQILADAAVEDGVDGIVGIHEHAVPVCRTGLELVVEHPAVMVDGQAAVGFDAIGPVLLVPQEGQQCRAHGLAHEVHHELVVKAVFFVAHDAHIDGRLGILHRHLKEVIDLACRHLRAIAAAVGLAHAVVRQGGEVFADERSHLIHREGAHQREGVVSGIGDTLAEQFQHAFSVQAVHFFGTDVAVHGITAVECAADRVTVNCFGIITGLRQLGADARLQSLERFIVKAHVGEIEVAQLQQ